MKNIENQIKQQLENREIPVSENAWDKLSGMIEENPADTLNGTGTIYNQTKKIRLGKWGLYYVAASVVVLISLFVANPFENAEIHENQIVNSEKTVHENSVHENEIIPNEISSEIANIEKETIQYENQMVKPELNSQEKEEFMIGDKGKIAQDSTEKIEISHSPEIKLNLPEIEDPQQIVSNEVPEIKPEPEKRKSKYVDADMLLYSVENNQVISESKDNTRLVIVDFNK